MSKKPQYDPEEIRFPDQHIVERSLVPEMEKSYIEYAMSVIVGRALPDVRDGLKPVHRRILYAMYEDNLTSDRPFKKSATCVGDVLGRYHPHGDASVYDALVRLAQDFSMRYMLVDGHGNFGSVDGDPPAAYRYTEARLSKISNEMLRDIRKDTVDWDPNFDESRKEPRVLPSRRRFHLSASGRGIQGNAVFPFRRILASGRSNLDMDVYFSFRCAGRLRSDWRRADFAVQRTTAE